MGGLAMAERMSRKVRSGFGAAAKYDLRAGILRWPHHLWLPPEGDTSARENLSEFLRMISPHTIIFSNIGYKTHNPERYNEIKKFVSKVPERDVNMSWTRDVSGDIVSKADQGPLFPHL